MMFTIIICILAGIGAGVGTGLAGLSAAAVISPMLIVCLKMDPYQAVGVALASDVLASLFSALTYARNKNVDLKNGLIMLISVLVFTFIGSYLASLLPGQAMGGFACFMTLLLGIKFLLKPVNKPKTANGELSNKKKIILELTFGSLIGFVCGFVGAGGGMMMLLVLVSFLAYDLKKAVGTSVFIMSFTAFVGAASHFIIDSTIASIPVLVTCVISTLIAAIISAKFANKSDPKVLNRVTGAVLTILGVVLVIFNFI